MKCSQEISNIPRLFTEEAESLYNSCLLVREGKGKGKVETLELGFLLMNFARLSSKKGECEEAEDRARRSLVMLERILGLQHPEVAKALTGLVFVRFTKCHDGLVKL